MSRYVRTFVAAIALLLLVAGAAFAAPGSKGEDHWSPVAASHQPSPAPDGESPEPTESDKVADADELGAEGAGPSEDALQRIVDRLADRDIETDTDTLAELAAQYGVGGAVRILTWADATGMDPADVAALRDEGKGWGQIVKQLNAEGEDLHLSPGNGWVMGHGQGLDKDHPHGPADAPGLNKD
jgi:hypothetical protein